MADQQAAILADGGQAAEADGADLRLQHRDVGFAEMRRE